MDNVRAKRMENELIGQSIGGWTVQSLLGAGKSAVVFEATNEIRSVALKVFDTELVERFGHSTQLSRINRELNLVGHHHSNLVEILGGGQCPDTGYLYVVMDFINSPNLAGTLDSIPSDRIGPLIRQVASAAEYLEQLGLVHRDIKPENIAVSVDFSRAVLLDLGVLRPFGESNLTDEEAKVFIGTLRYSSPEFLLRNEGHTREHWRAITFYQLGAVLHDMIMRRPLFHEFTEPFAILVEAVRSETPNIHSNDISPELVLLAQNCLVKDPDARLKLVSWEHFQRQGQRSTTLYDEAVARVRLRALRADLQRDVSTRQVPLTKDIASGFVKHIDDIVRLKCVGNRDFPRMQLAAESFESEARFDVVFESSSSHALHYPLLVRFECEVVDPATHAVRISVEASLVKDRGFVEGALEFGRLTVFQGPLHSDLFGDKVITVLYHAMDLAQRQLSHPPEVSFPVRLDLNSVMEVSE